MNKEFETACVHFRRVGRFQRPICRKGYLKKAIAHSKSGQPYEIQLADCANCPIAKSWNELSKGARYGI